MKHKAEISVFMLMASMMFMPAASGAQEPEIVTPESLSCRFVQTRYVSMLEEKAVSEGIMMFRKPDMIRWEYVSPLQSVFILNNGYAKMISEGREQKMELGRNSMIQGISKIMMAGLTGDCLGGNMDFTSRTIKSEEGWMAELTPVRKDFRRMFSRIVIHIRKADGIVDRIELFEPGGDSTDIRLHDIMTGIDLDENNFKTD